MNKKFTMFFVAALFISLQLTVKAQDDPRPYNPLAESVAKAIQEQFPDWKRTSVPPANKDNSISFSDDVIIDQWKSKEVIVKVAILIHPSKDEAAQALSKFASTERMKEYLPGVGNESYVWGIRKSVVFRKGRYIVYISTVPIDVSEDDAPLNLTPLPKETPYNKTFAHIVAKVLKDL
ncbi:MAG TPA: hypothetical protein VKB86_22270 [Pyrinomonadaceae bacterium]|nr:hypothetical protein [Pyrinomonadaceae bacterium]